MQKLATSIKTTRDDDENKVHGYTQLKESKVKKLILILTLSLPAICSADWTFAKIDRILFVEKGSSGLIYVYPEGGVNNPPACHGTNGDYTSFKADRPMAKEYISGLMAAMMADKKVGLRTTGDCVDQSISDTLMYFTVYNH